MFENQDFQPLCLEGCIFNNNFFCDFYEKKLNQGYSFLKEQTWSIRCKECLDDFNKFTEKNNLEKISEILNKIVEENTNVKLIPYWLCDDFR